jgi:hypothetical protein
MTERPDGRRREAPASASEGERLEALAALLGFEPPPFEGPLGAFELGEEREAGEPIYLGGDLHRVHPDGVDRRPGREHDHSLDAAKVGLDDYEHPVIEAVALDGLWCIALGGEIVDSAPYLTICDSEGRTRAWLLLPPARLMIGIGHLWLPSVPPPPGPTRQGR